MLITYGTFLEELYENMKAAAEELQDQADTIDSVVENEMMGAGFYDDEEPDDEDLDYEEDPDDEDPDYEEDPDDEDPDYEEEDFTDEDLAWLYVYTESADRIANNAAWCQDALESLEDLMEQPENSQARELMKQYFAAIQTWYELDENDRVSVRKAARAIEKIEEALADEGFTIFDGPATYVEMMEREDSEDVEASEDGYGDDEEGYDESKR